MYYPLGSSFVNYFSYLGSKGLESAALKELENELDKLLQMRQVPQEAMPRVKEMILQGLETRTLLEKSESLQKLLRSDKP